MPRSRLVLALAAAVVLILAGAGIVFLAGGLSSPAPVALVALASPAALSADERAFYEQVAPGLRAAAAEARTLTTQGRERSRNILAIRAGQGRLEAWLLTLDEVLAGAATPVRFAAVAKLYHPAAADIRAAIRQAEAAFLRFDWDGVGAATERMAAGTAGLEAAVRQLDTADRP